MSILDKVVTLQPGAMQQAGASAITSLNTNLYNLQQQQLQTQQQNNTAGGGKAFDILGNIINSAAGVWNVVQGVKSNTPVQNAMQQQPTVIYQQAPVESKPNNSMLIIVVVVVVAVIGAILLLSKKRS